MNKRSIEHCSRLCFAIITLMGALFFAFAGCTPTAPPWPESPTVSPEKTPTPVPLNLLVELKGKVEIKRLESGWRDYLPASFGTTAKHGDLLRTNAQASAHIFCSDISLMRIPPGYEGGIPCRGPTVAIMRKGSAIVPPLKGENLDFIPYIISPRRTKLKTANPILKWNPLSGVTTYTVIVRGDGLEWKKEVSATEMEYPPDAPRLVPGANYKLIVMGGGRSSEEEKTPGIGFSLLSSKETNELKVEEAKINGLALEDAAIRFIMGNLYASKELRSEAIAIFEALSTELEQPAVYRALGDLCLEVRLYSHAQERYARALELSKEMRDKEGEAAASVGLGLAYHGGRNNDEALKHLQAALATYREIGDSDKIAEVSKAIAGIER